MDADQLSNPDERLSPLVNICKNFLHSRFYWRPFQMSQWILVMNASKTKFMHLCFQSSFHDGSIFSCHPKAIKKRPELSELVILMTSQTHIDFACVVMLPISGRVQWEYLNLHFMWYHQITLKTVREARFRSALGTPSTACFQRFSTSHMPMSRNLTQDSWPAARKLGIVPKRSK
jgi:hypothetical protein